MISKIACLPFFKNHDATSRKIVESFKCPRFLQVKTTLKHCKRPNRSVFFRMSSMVKHAIWSEKIEGLSVLRYVSLQTPFIVLFFVSSVLF